METLEYAKSIVRTNEIIGAKVINTMQEYLGVIYEVVLDKKSGYVRYLVLESGSFLGLGGKLFALPWDSMKYDADEEAFILNLSQEHLKRAPGFNKENWPEMSDEKWNQAITDYFSRLS